MTWKECKNEKYKAKFLKDTVSCKREPETIPHCKCIHEMKKIMTVSHICEAKSAVKCETIKTRKCVNGKYSHISFWILGNS